MAVLGRRREALEITIQGFRDAMALHCDITQAGDVRNAVSTVLDEWGSIDVLVNNAGSALDKRILDTTDADWERVMRTNLDGTFFCTRECLRPMVQRGRRHIIVVASQAAGWPGFGEFAYGIAKTAQAKLVLHLLDEFRVLGKIAAREGRPAPDLHAHAVFPGPVDTPMWDELGRRRDGGAALLSPGHCAELIVHLAGKPGAVVEDFEGRPYLVSAISTVLPWCGRSPGFRGEVRRRTSRGPLPSASGGSRSSAWLAREGPSHHGKQTLNGKMGTGAVLFGTRVAGLIR